MPIYWITLVVLIALPLVLHLRGHGIVTLALSVAGLYGVGLLTLTALATLPPAAVSGLLTVMKVGQEGADGAFHGTYYIIVQMHGLLTSFLVFAATALTFWALGRWHAPHPEWLLRPLFWIAHLSTLAIPLSRVLLIGNGMPRRYIDYEDAMAPYFLALQITSTTAALAVLGLIGVAIWSILQRLRTHAL